MRARLRPDAREEGQALVEFALVLPLLLLLVFGMIQFALVLNARQTVAHAAHVAANAYAQTLERGRGDAEARSAAGQLRPPLSRPAGTIAYTIVEPGGLREVRESIVRQVPLYERRCRRFGFRLSCRNVLVGQRQIVEERVSMAQFSPTERPIIQDRTGKRGDYVVARVTYRYPSPVRAGLGPYRFPEAITLVAEGVARIEAVAGRKAR